MLSYIYRLTVTISKFARLLNKEFTSKIDLELIQAIQSGDTAAFDQLYRQFYPALYLLAFNLSKSEELSKDVVADVFLQIWEGRNGLQKVGNLQGYLYISVRNRTFNYLKNKALAANMGEAALLSAEPTADRFFEALLHTETIRAMLEAIQSLPPECRKVMQLVLKGYSTSDIADSLSITPSAVSHQKARAVRLLKDRFQTAFWAALLISTCSS